MIKIEHLYKNFDEKVLYQDFTYTFKEYGIVVIKGVSGCGKTTLLRMIAGLDKNYKGKITGVPNKISYVFQEACLLPASSAMENVALPLGNDNNAKKIAQDWLRKVGLEEDIHLYPSQMSKGMKQRVSLARALAFDGNLLLLDEPFSGIDAKRCNEILELLKIYAENKLCIMVTHNEEHIRYLNCDVIEL